MASDDFNRANETPLASPWILAVGTMPNLASNKVSAAGFTDSLIYYSGSVSSADQFAQLTTPLGSDDAGPAVRIQNSSDNGYMIDANVSTTYFKVISGSVSSIGATGISSYAANDTMRLEAQGSTITAYKNGAAGTPITDSSITAAGDGAGFFMFANDIDNWSGGDLVVAAQGLPVKAWKPNFVYLRKNR